MNKKTLTAIAIILALLFIGSLIWGFNRNSAATELAEEKVEMTGELSQLELLRNNLQAQVDSISIVYESAAADNASLKGELAEAQKLAQAALYDMRKAQKSRQNDNDVAYQMRLQIEDLVSARANLERNLAELETENKSLRQENVGLRQNLSTAKTENYELAKKSDALEQTTRRMETEINAITLGAFKASAMQVDLYRGNSGTKTTTDASRVKRMAVSFDLTAVPSKYLGVRPIYLVMTDESGTPVISENPVRAKAMVNGAEMNVIALEGRDVNVEKNQRISFTHEMSTKLQKGFYRVQILTDLGLLGATNVQLR